MDIPAQVLRTCSRCKTKKPLEVFLKAGTSLASWCESCRKKKLPPGYRRMRAGKAFGAWAGTQLGMPPGIPFKAWARMSARARRQRPDMMLCPRCCRRLPKAVFLSPSLRGYAKTCKDCRGLPGAAGFALEWGGLFFAGQNPYDPLITLDGPWALAEGL